MRNPQSRHRPSQNLLDEDVQEVDLDHERRQRRQSLVRRNLDHSFPSEDIAKHYQDCIQMGIDNKINVKNAFDLRVIDILADKCGQQNRKVNFREASSALAASTSIYAYRVENLYNNTLKLDSQVRSKKDGEKGRDDQPTNQVKEKEGQVHHDCQRCQGN